MRTILSIVFTLLILAAVSFAQDAVEEGERFVELGRYSEAVRAYEKALAGNPDSSLAHYRLGEVLFFEKDYQTAANEFLESVNGDQEPGWTLAWAHIQLGMIFDLTGQRARAVERYRMAIRTGDETRGARETAAGYLERPYRRPQGRR